MLGWDSGGLIVALWDRMGRGAPPCLTSELTNRAVPARSTAHSINFYSNSHIFALWSKRYSFLTNYKYALNLIPPCKSVFSISKQKELS